MTDSTDEIDNDDTTYKLSEKGKNIAIVMGVAYNGGVDLDTLAYAFDMVVPEVKIILAFAGISTKHEVIDDNV